MPKPLACDNALFSKMLRHFLFSVFSCVATFSFAVSGAMCLADDSPLTEPPSALKVKKSSAETDWVAKEDLSPEQKVNLSSECSGLYLDPFADEPTPDPALTLIEIEAGTANMAADAVELRGDVDVKQGSRVIQAGAMNFNKITEQATLQGDVSIRQAGSLIKGESASVNMIGNEAAFTEGSFLSHNLHMRGSAARIAHEANGKLVMEEGRFTSCEPYSQAWELSGRSLVIDPEAQQGSGRDVVIRMGGIPILYTPYIRFPVGGSKQTGLLTPSLGTISGQPDIALPWYWNIAPNQDATLTPRFVGGRGPMLEAEYRYLGFLSSNILQLSYLPNDQGGISLEDETLATNDPDNQESVRAHKGDSRNLLQLQHDGGFQRPWYSHIDYGRVSDIDVLRDLPAASFNVTNETYLTQNATFGYDFTNWHVSANLYNAQNLLSDIDDSYQRLPQFQAEGNYRFGDFGVRTYNEFVRFDHKQKTHLDGTPIITGDRARLNYELIYRQESSWGFFKPSAGFQAITYTLNDNDLKAGIDTSPTLSTHYTNLDGGLYFEDASGQQSLEPRLYYLFRQYVDHSALFNVTGDGQNLNFDTSPLTFSYDQLFRAHRFAGGDRLDDTNQLTLGITHRMSFADGTPLWDVSLGQLFYFDDRRIGLNAQTDTSQESDIATQYKIYLDKSWQTLGSLQYNPEIQKIMRSSFGVHFNDEQWLINLDYRYAREQVLATGELSQRIDQLDTSFYLPIQNQWQLVGRSFYDLDEQRELETFIGFEYSACCYRIRTVARRWLDAKLALKSEDTRKPYDQGLFFEIELIGLGGSGNRIETLLSESIFGYQPDR